MESLANFPIMVSAIDEMSKVAGQNMLLPEAHSSHFGASSEMAQSKTEPSKFLKVAEV